MVERTRMNISLTKEENALIKKLAKEEKKRIQKDKIIGEEEDEEKEPEEENEYKKGKDEEKDYKYEEDERRRRI